MDKNDEAYCFKTLDEAIATKDGELFLIDVYAAILCKYDGWKLQHALPVTQPSKCYYYIAKACSS